MNSSLVILADRGNVKSYRVEKAPAGRPPRLRLTQEFTLEEAHQRIGDRASDQAGSFPANTTKGSNGGASISDRHLELEVDRRLFKQLGEHITSIVLEENPAAWAFAAPSEINPSILDSIDPAVRGKITENVPRNLVKTRPEELAEHFESVPGE